MLLSLLIALWAGGAAADGAPPMATPGQFSVTASGAFTYASPSERLSYDAWGRHRHGNDWTDDPTCTSGSATPTRGFTGQEEMDAVCDVNLNARVYDPTIGRFLSPDSVTETAYDLQILYRAGAVATGSASSACAGSDLAPGQPPPAAARRPWKNSNRQQPRTAAARRNIFIAPTHRPRRRRLRESYFSFEVESHTMHP